MFGGKPTKEEEEYLSTLKNRKHTDVIGSDEINRNIVHGTRSALGQFNDQVNESRGTLAFQGMENSVLNQQIGLDERQELADSLNTSANDLRAEARVENRNARMDAEDQFYELKSALAERRRATKEQAFGDMVDGATGVVGYLNEPKYLASLKNQGTPTQPQVMGYTPSASTGGNLGQGQSALNFGRQRALGKPNTILPPQSSINTSQAVVTPQVGDLSNPNKNPYDSFSNASDRRADRGKINKKSKKGSAFRTTTYAKGYK